MKDTLIEMKNNLQGNNGRVDEPTAKIALPRKDNIQNQRADKELPRQEKTKGVHHHQTIII